MMASLRQLQSHPRGGAGAAAVAQAGTRSFPRGAAAYASPLVSAAAVHYSRRHRPASTNTTAIYSSITLPYGRRRWTGSAALSGRAWMGCAGAGFRGSWPPGCRGLSREPRLGAANSTATSGQQQGADCQDIDAGGAVRPAFGEGGGEAAAHTDVSGDPWTEDVEAEAGNDRGAGGTPEPFIVLDEVMP